MEPMEDKANGQNRRKSERKDVAFTLSYCVDRPYTLRISLGVADDINALMLNLSDLGMAIVTTLDLLVGTRLDIRFNLMNLNLFGEKRTRQMRVTAEVVSKVALSKGNYRIGLRFDKITEEDKMAISDFIKHSKFNT